MRSSYIKNCYDEVFYRLIRTYGPKVLVELGVLDGYSTLAMARAIRDNKGGKLMAYDLFEKYPFTHGTQAEVQQHLDAEGLSEFVDLIQIDAFGVFGDYEPNSVHLLHVDLSNTGTILRKVMEQWHDKLVYGGLLLFEGGSEERDNVQWMQQYEMEPIKPELESNAYINGGKFVYGTYLKFPSLTCLMKKH